ncbi:peptidyl-tRNA hydrolase ArfB [bacterium BMS3Abin02]|nr:peptidyl-tRNA hydrolase ArfB [bacterium BMS3Abin02]GBE22549.1 peptidyl-tRNA hydrolase ArfB [bacterium BMS3Bbin01]HDH25080.1 aminoacyl-tRNA hydrolase [Actinomycetota bacterium]
MSEEPLRVDADFVIPGDELVWRFETSGGPGGQHANRSRTRAELSFDLGASEAVGAETKQRMLARLGRRARSGVVTVAVDESRSQWRNRQMARRRLADLLRDAMTEPKSRRPTKPSGGARRRRLEAKRARGAVKRLRRPPEAE